MATTDVDLTKDFLVLYKKDGTKVTQGTVGAKSVSVTGLAAGTAVAAGDYKVAWSDGTAETESAKTDVPAFTVKPATVAVTGVTIDATASVAVGATVTPKAAVAPTTATDKALTFSTSDEAIATVDAKGVVTGVAAGTAKITATSHDGAKTGECTVTVTAPAK